MNNCYEYIGSQLSTVPKSIQHGINMNHQNNKNLTSERYTPQELTIYDKEQTRG